MRFLLFLLIFLLPVQALAMENGQNLYVSISAIVSNNVDAVYNEKKEIVTVENLKDTFTVTKEIVEIIKGEPVTVLLTEF